MITNLVASQIENKFYLKKPFTMYMVFLFWYVCTHDNDQRTKNESPGNVCACITISAWFYLQFIGYACKGDYKGCSFHLVLHVRV
jgi:hypothetical protein